MVLDEIGQEDKVIFIHSELHKAELAVKSLILALSTQVRLQRAFVELHQEILAALIYLLGYEDVDCLESSSQSLLLLWSSRYHLVKCEPIQFEEERIFAFGNGQLNVTIVDPY